MRTTSRFANACARGPPNTIEKCPVKGRSEPRRRAQLAAFISGLFFSVLPHAFARRLPVVSRERPHAVATKHHYGLARSVPLSPSGHLALRRFQIRRWHNAGLPNQSA